MVKSASKNNDLRRRRRKTHKLWMYVGSRPLGELGYLGNPGDAPVSAR